MTPAVATDAEVHCGPGEPGTIVLSGFMGAGKTTVGRRLAARLGLPFVDLDEEIEHAAGRDVCAIFAELGEPAFRDLEARCLHEQLSRSRSVIAVGGGAMLSAENRAAARRAGTLVTLDVSVNDAESRIRAASAGERARPNFEGDPQRLAALWAARQAAYADADLRVDTNDLDPEVVVERVWRALAAHGVL